MALLVFGPELGYRNSTGSGNRLSATSQAVDQLPIGFLSCCFDFLASRFSLRLLPAFLPSRRCGDLTIGSSSVVGSVVTSPGDRTYHSVGSQQRVLAARDATRASECNRVANSQVCLLAYASVTSGTRLRRGDMTATFNDVVDLYAPVVARPQLQRNARDPIPLRHRRDGQRDCDDATRDRNGTHRLPWLLRRKSRVCKPISTPSGASSVHP